METCSAFSILSGRFTYRGGAYAFVGLWLSHILYYSKNILSLFCLRVTPATDWDICAVSLKDTAVAFMFGLHCSERDICQGGQKSQPSTWECQWKTNIPSMWHGFLCFPDLHCYCSVCVCVVLREGFVLSAPVYSCVLPLSFTAEKGTTPLRPRPSVCACVSLSWDFKILPQKQL